MVLAENLVYSRYILASVATTGLSESLEGINPRAAYLCGPPVMVESTAEALVGLGVAPGAVWMEKHD